MRTFLTLAIALVAAFSSINAAAPTAMNYQGLLTDNVGAAVADASYSVIFTIYDAPASGTSVWTEMQNVTTTDGLFAVLLGSVNPMLDTVFNGTTRYLGIAVAGDPEISPRTALVSVPYAQRVSTVDGASGGNITSKVSIGTDDPLEQLSVFGNFATRNAAGDTVVRIDSTSVGGGALTTFGPAGSRNVRLTHMVGNFDYGAIVLLNDAGERDDPRVSPLRAADLSALPPAFVVTAQYDPLCDEGEAYANRLRDAGVEVEYRKEAGQIHGFVSMAGSIDAGRRTLEDASAALRRAFAQRNQHDF